MAGKRVLEVLLVGDSTGMERAMDRAATAAGKVGDHAAAVGGKVDDVAGRLTRTGNIGHASFGQISDAAAESGQNLGLLPAIFERIDVALDRVHEQASRAGKAIVGIGALGAGLGTVALFAGAHDRESAKELENAVDNLKLSFADYREEFEKAANEQAKFGHSNDEATRALAILTTASKDPAQAVKDLGLASNLAAKEHIGLAEAAQQVASVYGGNFKVLRQFGEGIKDLVDTTKLLEKAHADEITAVEHVKSAQQRLTDFEAVLSESRRAAQDKHAAAVEAADQRVEDSSQKLADARRHLADVEASVAEQTKLTVADQYSLADAQQKVRDVQERIADGDLKGADATMALRDAQQNLARIQAEQTEKQKVSVSDQRQLRDAAEGVTKATDAHSEAVKKATAARAADTGGPTLQQLQQEHRLRADLHKAIGEQAHAEQDLAHAKTVAAEQGGKVEQALGLLRENTDNAAKLHAEGVLGWMRKQIAEVENLFGRVGTGSALALITASSVITGLGPVFDIFRGRAAAAATAAATVGEAAVATAAVTEGAAAATVAAEEGVAVASEAAGAATSIGLGPILLIFAAIGVAAWLLHKYWHQIWTAIANLTKQVWDFLHPIFDAIVKVALFPIRTEIKILESVWSAVWGGIKSVVSDVWDFLKPIFDAIGNGIGKIVDVAGKVGGFVGKVGGHLIPHFGDGGMVPGPIGSEQLILAHGGETVLPTHKQRLSSLTSSPTSGGAMVIEHRHYVEVSTGALLLDERSSRAFADRLAPAMIDEFHKHKTGDRIGDILVAPRR